MGKPSPGIWMSFALLAACGGPARAQAVTEYDSEISRSATTGSKANHISSEIGGVWRSLDKTLKPSSDEHVGSQETSSGRTTQHAHSRSISRRASRSSATAGAHEDPIGIQPGISFAELLRRFGRPDFEVTDSTGTTTLSYLRKDGTIDLELQDGNVIKVASAKPQEIAVVAPK
jgi:hypothetical protein